MHIILHELYNVTLFNSHDLGHLSHSGISMYGHFPHSFTDLSSGAVDAVNLPVVTIFERPV